MDFPTDIIGINIMLQCGKGNSETYISAKLDLKNEIVDEDEFSEKYESEDLI